MNQWAKSPGMRKTSEPAVPGAHQELHDSNKVEKMNSLRVGALGAIDGIVSVAALLIGVIATGTGDKAILMAGLAPPSRERSPWPVSYTHLTLPTICSV